MNKKLNEATIRLFKGVLHVKSTTNRPNSKARELIEKCIRNGFIFYEGAEYNDEELIDIVKKELGINAKELNASFHKSWEKVRNASDEQLFIEQILHYITTYGFEGLGIYDENTVYIPHERLEIPELKEDIKLVLIKGYTKEELKEKTLNFLDSGIALKEQTMKDLITIINYVGIDADEIENIKNKEIKIQFYDRLGIIPKNPTEFLRYLVFKQTGETLIIKNDKLIEKIKEIKSMSFDSLVNQYKQEYGLEKLATIFNRFKPIWLAFKNQDNFGNINKISKLSKKYHKPMKEDYLNEITSIIKNNEILNIPKLDEELNSVNIWRKIRLAYALKFRTTDSKSIMYRVRNGRSWAKELNLNNSSKINYKIIYDHVLDNITKEVSENIRGKKIYLPENIHYTLPSSEKQFIGNFPDGSYIECPENMIVGIHWFNNKERVDLDLKMSGISGQIGWNNSYRTEERDVMFSGDITDPNKETGASELFRFTKQPKNPYIMTVNYYNYVRDNPSDFKILVADEKPKNFKKNYMVDPNNLIASCKTTIFDKQMVLGLIIPEENGSKYYFTETGLGNTIVANDTDYLRHAREFLIKKFENQIELKEVLQRCCAIFVEDKDKADIDLSPENLEKDTIINLLLNKK